MRCRTILLRGLSFACLAVGAAVAQAADLRMQVRGELGIDPQGKVYQTSITTILTPEVMRLVEKNVRSWQFEPVLHDGKPAYAKTNMTLDLLATQVDAGYQLRIENVRFLYGSRRAARMVPPRYPTDLMRAGINADVLVAMRIDAAGKVQDAVAVQVSLPYRNVTEKQVARWGRSFEKSSVDAAKQWVYEPADPEQGDAREVTVVVPVSYRMSDGKSPPMPSGGWQYATERVNKPIPWLSAEQQEFDATGLKQGESLALGQETAKLKSPVIGNTL